jgi:hypothetical protein
VKVQCSLGGVYYAHWLHSLSSRFGDIIIFVLEIILWNKYNKYFELHLINWSWDNIEIYCLHCSVCTNFSGILPLFTSGKLCFGFVDHVMQMKAVVILPDLTSLATGSLYYVVWLMVYVFNKLTPGYSHSNGGNSFFIKSGQLEPFLPCYLKLKLWENEGEIVRYEIKN